MRLITALMPALKQKNNNKNKEQNSKNVVVQLTLNGLQWRW